MRESTTRAPRTRRVAHGPIAATAALALVLTACSGGAADTDEGTGGGADGATFSGELTVFAAASLTDVFEEIATSFEKENPQVEITFNFAGSGELAQQINSGAPADVFAAADTDTMDQVVEGEGLDTDWAAENGEDGRIFVANSLRIAVPPDDPAGIESLDDLAEDDVDVAFCSEEVPCGSATATALEAADLDITPVTLEEDVRAVLTKVELGEVDAGLVYATDVISAGDRVQGLDFPESEEAINDYPIGVLSASGDPDLAAAWVDFVTTEGAPVLRDAGFGTP